MTTINSRLKIGIIGGGVIGLTCARRIISSFTGIELTIIANKIGYETDSRNATAIWHVYLVPETTQILHFARETLEFLINAESIYPLSGIELVSGVELFRKGAAHRPSWADIPPSFALLTPAELAEYNEIDECNKLLQPSLPSHPVLWGYRLQTPAADMKVFLPWLEEAVLTEGVAFNRETLESINQVTDRFDIIVNCSGIGARELASDATFVPYKGQYFVLKKGEDAPSDYIGDDDNPYGMAYVIPRGDEVLVGGCAIEGVEDTSFTLNFEEVKQRSGLYVPWLRRRGESEQSRSPVVGIRPARAAGVRLELDTDSYTVPVIHNYGHGGSGFSLAWGCAGEVVQMINRIASCLGVVTQAETR